MIIKGTILHIFPIENVACCWLEEITGELHFWYPVWIRVIGSDTITIPFLTTRNAKETDG